MSNNPKNQFNKSDQKNNSDKTSPDTNADKTGTDTDADQTKTAENQIDQKNRFEKPKKKLILIQQDRIVQTIIKQKNLLQFNH
jgi:hypothetical protein